MKLCKDCAHKDGAMCRSGNRPVVSMTNGDTIPEVTCKAMRDHTQWCGPDAKWFEVKAPELPPLERCPEGHEAEYVCEIAGQFYVKCSGKETWMGGTCHTKDEAIAAWNAVMRAYREAREKADEEYRKALASGLKVDPYERVFNLSQKEGK